MNGAANGNRRLHAFTVLALNWAVWAPLATPGVSAADLERAVQLGGRYLECADPEEKASLAEELAGHSMGGFGAYHQVQRQPDRFAAEGELEYDALLENGKGHGKDSPIGEWNAWQLSRRKVRRDGAMIEAINRGNNLIEITNEVC